MEIYHYPASSTLEIAEGSRTTTVELPAGLDPVEVANLIKSGTMRAVVAQLTERIGADG